MQKIMRQAQIFYGENLAGILTETDEQDIRRSI